MTTAKKEVPYWPSVQKPPSLENEPAFLIFYEDQEVKPEVFMGHGAEQGARDRFKQISGNWNAHLFQRIERNSKV